MVHGDEVKQGSIYLDSLRQQSSELLLHLSDAGVGVEVSIKELKAGSQPLMLKRRHTHNVNAQVAAHGLA